jgi:tetratricopeptide (TPR) repeat protein
VIAWYGHHAYLGHCLRKANHFLAVENLQQSRDFFQKAAAFPLSGGVGLDGLAGLALIRGDREEAQTHFDEALRRRPSHEGARVDLLLHHFLREGLYEEGGIYRDYLLSMRSLAKLQAHILDFAALSLGNRQLAEARRMLTNAPPAMRSEPRYEELLAQADQWERVPLVPVVLDRAKQTIVHFDLVNQDYQFSTPVLFNGWPDPGMRASSSFLTTLERRDRFNLIVTTLDLNVQRSVHQAMRGFEGSFVVLDPASGALLAAYGSKGMDPFAWTFEPGSVVKLLTYGVLLQNQLPLAPYAPQTYPGSRLIAGKTFYDWTQHGLIADVDEGMAVSCNLMFAQMGIDLGLPRLQSAFEKVFTDRNLPAFFSPTTQGRLRGQPSSAWEVGRFAIGLDYFEASALGLAQIAALVAAGGSLPEPHLLEHIETHESHVYRRYQSTLPPLKVFAEQVNQALKSSMEAAVRHERGTARRVDAPYVKLALKTGTAGDPPYDAIMVGFLPADRPKLAFGFCLRRGGKSELNGAAVTHSFLEHIRVLAPAYLEP